MDTLQIQIPEGHEVDTFDPKTGLITFKKKTVEKWRDKFYTKLVGFFIDHHGIQPYESDYRTIKDKLVFSTEKQAQSVYAFAELSKIIANDSRFGGPITDKEWNISSGKYTIRRVDNTVKTYTDTYLWTFLAFHTAEQRNLFLKENEDLIKQYFML